MATHPTRRRPHRDRHAFCGLCPLENIGLMIVDEEHDPSYRQHESPFYNARDVAVMRGQCAGAVVVLGSATPAMESFYNAQSGKYTYLHTTRPHRRTRPGTAELDRYA